MRSNPVWLVPLLYGVGLAATGGATWYGWRQLQEYQQGYEEELRQRQETARMAEAEAGARNRMLMAQLNPFMIAGTVVMTGLGAFIIFSGKRRQRRRRRELIEAY